MKKLIVFFILLNSYYAFSQAYFVSPLGIDLAANLGGGSLNNPWKTFQYAISQVSAGDTVYFRGGIYPSSFIIFNKSGSANNYLIFKNYQNEIPIIDGGNITQTLLLINSQSYIILDGFHFRNVLGNNSRGVFVEGDAHHISFLNCKIYNINETNTDPYLPNNCNGNVSPIKFCGNNNTNPMTNIILKGNEVFSCRTGCSEGMSISGNVNNFLIENNSVHDISNIGIVAAGHYSSCGTGQAKMGKIIKNKVYRCRFPNTTFNNTASGIYIDGGENIVAEQNLVYECQIGIQIGCENIGKTAQFDTIRNNIVYNNDRWGIGVGSGALYPSNAGKSRFCAVFNNTIFKNASKNFDYDFFNRYGELRVAYTDYSSIQNNIIYANTDNRLLTVKYDSLIGNQINHNVYFAEGGQVTENVNWDFTNYSFSDFQNITAIDLQSIFSNPQFNGVDITALEVHLQPNSPAINFSNLTSQQAAGSFDFDGNNRKNGQLDAGALESQCPNSFIIQGILTNNAIKFESTQSIQALNIIKSGANAIFNSQKSILLLPKFETESGSIFKAQIDGCENN